MESEKRLQHLDLEQGQINYLSHIYVYVKLTSHSCYKQKTLLCSVLIMAAQDEAEIRLEENPGQRPPEDQRQNSDGSSPTEVLETMRNLIVELQVFKAHNEKLKKAQHEQKEINEVLLQSIVTKKTPKDDNQEEEVSKRATKNFVPEVEKGDKSSEGTPPAEDKTKTDRKRK
jgi:hypothetical protein